MILQQAINHYGVEKQLNKVDEELKELKEALKNWRNDKYELDNVIDEMADVKIMLMQLKIILEMNCKLDITEEVNQRIDFKLNRLKQRIEDDTK